MVKELSDEAEQITENTILSMELQEEEDLEKRLAETRFQLAYLSSYGANFGIPGHLPSIRPLDY